MPLIPVILDPTMASVHADRIDIVERLGLLTRKVGEMLDRIGALEAEQRHQQESLGVVTGNLSKALDRLDRAEDSIRTLTRNLSQALDRIDALEAKR